MRSLPRSAQLFTVAVWLLGAVALAAAARGLDPALRHDWRLGLLMLLGARRGARSCA